jgi:hypothetical protein
MRANLTTSTGLSAEVIGTASGKLSKLSYILPTHFMMLLAKSAYNTSLAKLH